MKVLILGDGATGTAAVEEIRRVDSSSEIVMIADEPNPSYFRAALTNYLLGELTDRQLQAVAPDFYHRHRVTRLFGRAMQVRPQQKQVVWQRPDGGQSVEQYDRLIISTGSRPRVHNAYAKYMHLPWVRTLRTLVDAKEMEERLQQGRIQSAVVVGGGPLAMEWVAVMRRRGVDVHLFLRKKESLMRDVLDGVARDLLLARMKQEGVHVHIDEIQHIKSDASGNVVEVLGLKSSVKADFVGLAMGVEPNSECVANAGLRMHKRWIMTNEAGQTTDHYIYAGGDVASIRERGSLGLWGPARKMGILIGRHITKQTVMTTQYTHYFATRLYDLDCVFAGQLNVEGSEVLAQTTPSEGNWGYRRLVIHQGLLVGFLCLGEVAENVRKQARLWHELIDVKIQVRDVQDKLLLPQFDLDSWMNTRLNSRFYQPFSDPWEPPPPPQQPSIQLQPTAPVIKNTVAGTEWRVEPNTKLGRAADSLVDFQRAVQGGDSVSSRHASIRWDGRRYMLKDLGSSNGTYLNDRRIFNEVPLRVNDVIRFGDSSFVFDPTDFQQIKDVDGVERQARAVQTSTVVEVLWDNGNLRLSKEWHRIGRAPTSDIHLHNDSVSTNHAELVWQGKNLYIRDLGSTNGTYWNDERVTVPVPIQNTGVLTVGTVSISIRVLKESLQASGTNSRPPEPANALQNVNMWKVLSDGKEFFIERGGMLKVGRSPDNDIVPSNDSVSSRHAVISWDRERPTIVDVGSSNGSKLNGRTLQRDQAHYLNDGDEVFLGEHRMEIQTVVGKIRSSQPQVVDTPPQTRMAKPTAQKVPIPPKPQVTSALLRASHASPTTMMVAEGQSVIVGRDGNRANWVMTESSVSGRHGAFRIHNGQVEYRDLGSSNGSFAGTIPIGEHWQRVTSDGIRLGELCTIQVEGGQS